MVDVLAWIVLFIFFVLRPLDRFDVGCGAALLAGSFPPYPDDPDELLCRDLLELPLLCDWLLLQELLYAESETFVLCDDSVPSIVELQGMGKVFGYF